jgi:hypothetical protein
MSKAKQSAPSMGSVTVTSMKDAGYQSAISSERIASVARYVYGQCPNFTNEVSDEIKTQLRAGWALRWQELNPAVAYNENWIPVESGGSHVMSVDVCFSYSQQAFGQLKDADPVKHGIIKGVRDAFNKYASNRMADLKTAVRKVENEGKPKIKAPTKGFTQYLDDTFKAVKARAKTAKARGDDACPDEVKLRMAIDAFYNTLSK